MIDVGANFGNSLDIYLGKGWQVHAFEPDPNNRQKLLETWPDCDRLTVNSNAVSDEAGQKVAFYASEESTGISGLSAFTAGHKKIGEVETTTLTDYYRSSGLEHVDFLKIDVEGFDILTYSVSRFFLCFQIPLNLENAFNALSMKINVTSVSQYVR